MKQKWKGRLGNGSRVLHPLGPRQAKNALWLTRTRGSQAQRGKHFMIQAEKAHLAPMRFKGTAFASGHPHTETVDIRAKALDRLHMIIGRAKVEVAAGTPSSLNKALRYLEAQFKIGMHPGQAFGSQGISGLEQEPFYANAKQTVMQARYLFNQGLYTDSEERRTQLFEESSQLILNLDAAIPFVPKAPKEERPPISVEVSPKIEPRIYMPRRRIKKAKAPTVEPKPEEENPAAVKAPEEPEEKIKRQIENGRLGLKAWKLRETRKRLKEFQEKSQEEAEARKLELGIKREEALAKSAATREAARRALSE